MWVVEKIINEFIKILGKHKYAKETNSPPVSILSSNW